MLTVLTPTVLKDIIDGSVNVPPDMLPNFIVDKVREYFNDNDIPYADFCYEDLIPYLPQ